MTKERSNSPQDLESPPILTDGIELQRNVAEDDTVPSKVLWQPQERSYTDVPWGVLYVLAYLAFMGCGITLAVNANPRYEINPETNLRMIASVFQSDVTKCCASIGDSTADQYDLCSEQAVTLNGGDESARRYLAETGDSRFNGDEGIFDAFLEAPEIIVGILSVTVVVALLWIVLLRFFSKPIVIGTEVVKIGLFIYAGIVQEVTATRVFCFLIAFGILAYDIWARKQILFAADIIAHSVTAFKESPTMFLGVIAIQILFVSNAFLFVYFFAQAFDNAKVEHVQDCFDDNIDGTQTCYSQCVFVYHDYISGMSVFMSLAYLWTIFLFSKMRLGVIANMIGSWHFHPQNQPGVVTAMRNTITTSFGTLAVSSLISTVAERINRLAQEPCYRSWLGPGFCITAPLSLVMCIFGACIATVLKMLTKFAVILHVWTGLPFVGSAKKVFKIMSRHFKGGFVTEVTSEGVLRLASFVFSLCVALLTWTWLDKKFDTDTLPGGSDATFVIAYVLFGLFNLWYPVLGLYLIILANKFLRPYENQHLWVPPLAAIFVGCLAMMFFTFISAIFLDTIDVLFLCFAVDKDNGVDMSKHEEFEKLIKTMPDNPYLGDIVKEDDDIPVAIATAVPAGSPVSQEAVTE